MNEVKLYYLLLSTINVCTNVPMAALRGGKFLLHPDRSEVFMGRSQFLKNPHRARFRCDFADKVRRRLPNLPVQTDLSSVEWNTVKSSSEVGEE